MSGTNAVPVVNSSDSKVVPVDSYTVYTGDGSSWPGVSEWISYEDMLTNNMPYMGVYCNEVFSVAPNNANETALVAHAIDYAAQMSEVDQRFILAIIMQESKACVRIPTTNYGTNNPGIMQSHDGIGTCNAGTLQSPQTQDPCPEENIYQMLEDGVMGTSTGDGLAKLLNQVKGTGAQAFYQAARMYNSGSIAPSGDLGQGIATHCYATDVVNRLQGWVKAPSMCTLDCGNFEGACCSAPCPT